MTTPIDPKVITKDYDAILSTRDNKYCLYISELQIVATGDSLNATYQELNRKKDERIKEFENAGILDKLPVPSPSSTNEAKTRAKESGLFFIKSLIVGFMFIMVITFTANKVNDSLSAIPGKLKTTLKKLPRQIALELEYHLNGIAEVDIAPARRENIKNNLRTAGRNIKPYLEEFRRELTRESAGTETPDNIEIQ